MTIILEGIEANFVMYYKWLNYYVIGGAFMLVKLSGVEYCNRLQ